MQTKQKTTTKKYITWIPGTDEGRIIWEALHIDDEELYLGYLHLKNWGKHTHWTWTQMPEIDMSPGCLEEVREKQKELFKQRKVEK